MSALGQRRHRSVAAEDDGMPLRSHALHRATYALALAHPEFSARRIATGPQLAVLAALVVTTIAATLIWPRLTVQFVVAGMSAGFLISLALRTTLAAVGRAVPIVDPPTDRSCLPCYTVLVPLYHETSVLPQLARAMGALDYPRDRLDLKFIVEEDDHATREAAERLNLPGLIVVPPGRLRTKPKACNYALQFARGAHLVIYDAEDRPDPDQLLKAVAAFRANPDVACFQARLTVDTRSGGWISRMFALDYAVWFKTLLPGLAHLRAPVPLGGTSNHFRTDVLIQAGGWDPYNVTEDADLGYRLARLGRRVSMLDSNTCEEAPPRLRIWLRQRTRWMKGYMQTLLVHTRNPVLLARSVGVRGCLMMQALLGGAVWSALVNPLLWAIFIVGSIGADRTPGFLDILARISGLTLLAANALLVALSLLEDGSRLKIKSLLPVLSYPVYWLLISLAAYRALWQIARDPFRWEKTPHGSDAV